MFEQPTGDRCQQGGASLERPGAQPMWLAPDPGHWDRRFFLLGGSVRKVSDLEPPSSPLTTELGKKRGWKGEG